MSEAEGEGRGRGLLVSRIFLFSLSLFFYFILFFFSCWEKRNAFLARFMASLTSPPARMYPRGCTWNWLLNRVGEPSFPDYSFLRFFFVRCNSISFLRLRVFVALWKQCDLAVYFYFLFVMIILSVGNFMMKNFIILFYDNCTLVQL